MKRYLGVDLHRTQFTVCTRLENGRTYLRQWPMRDLKVFAAQLSKEDELAVESTGNTRLFHDAVIEHVARSQRVEQLKARGAVEVSSAARDFPLLCLANTGANAWNNVSKSRASRGSPSQNALHAYTLRRKVLASSNTVDLPN